MERKGKIIALFIANALFVLATIGLIILASTNWGRGKKKDYDMSGVVFDDLTVEYDGQPHSILATNLPEGVSVSYDNNDQTEIGTYTVTAHFYGDEERYNPIPDKTATLTVSKPAKSRILSATGFEIDETSEPPRIYCDVSNTTEQIDLSDKITVMPNRTWKLYKDINGDNELISKTMSLETGHNIAYIIITDLINNTAIYEVDVYRLDMKSYTFKNEGQIHASGEIEEKSQLESPAIPEKTYYTFTGWAIEGGTDIVQFPYTVTEDITFVAQYALTNYVITYYLNGGTNDARNPAYYTIESSDIELYPATRDGYVFDGWYSDGEFGTQVTVIQSGTFGAKSLYAKWTYGSGGLIYEQIGTEYKVIGYNGNDSEIIVPDTWKSLPVTAIGKGVFANCTNLEKLTIPFVGATKDGDTNTHFGYIFGAPSYTDNAKYVPTSLKTVTITGGSTIANAAFSNCASIKSITLPDGLTFISSLLFACCTSLESINIPNSVWSISASAFLSCESLTDIEIPANVTSIGNNAFGACSSLTSIIIPDSVRSIGESAFYGCKSLEEITLPFVGATMEGATNTHFGYIFGASSYMGNSSYVPSSLRTVVITSGTAIGDYAFYKCANIESITIPDSIIKIGDHAFDHCKSLKSITIPDSVAFIGYSAFESCTGLTAVYITDMAKWCNINFNYFTGNPLFYAQNLYLNNKLVTVLEIPDSVTCVGTYAFAFYEKLTSVTFGKSSQLTSIEGDAFYRCESLSNVEIPATVTSIGSNAFSLCISLTSATFGENSQLIAISDFAFEECKKLKSIEIPDSVISIGRQAFYRCESLTKITIPAGVTSIDFGAFLYCEKLTSVVFKRTSGWTADDTSISSSNLENSATAAKYLKDTYCLMYWKRTEAE